MRKLGMTLSVAGLALLGACSRGNDARSDDALKNDLALAAQAQPYQAQQFVSPMEGQYAPYGAQQYNATARSPYYATAPVYSPAPVYRAPARTTTRRSSSGSSGTYYPAPAREPVRHTKRDAAIGAAAGAVIGAVSSRDKVKGGLIGAAAGGILGGIIGHTVDVQKYDGSVARLMRRYWSYEHENVVPPTTLPTPKRRGQCRFRACDGAREGDWRYRDGLRGHASRFRGRR